MYKHLNIYQFENQTFKHTQYTTIQNTNIQNTHGCEHTDIQEIHKIQHMHTYTYSKQAL